MTQHTPQRLTTYSELLEEGEKPLIVQRNEIDRLQIRIIRLQQKRLNDLVERLDKLTEGKDEPGEHLEEEIKEGIRYATKGEIEEALELELESAIEKFTPPKAREGAEATGGRKEKAGEEGEVVCVACSSLHPPPSQCALTHRPSPCRLACATALLETQRRKNSWTSLWFAILYRTEHEIPTRETICTAIAMVSVAVTTSNSAPNPMTVTSTMNNILWALVLRYMLRKLFYAIRL